MKIYACCFIGHRKIKMTDEMKEKLKNFIEYLIVELKVSVFLFGSVSQFDDLCHEIVTNLKEKYPHIERVVYPCRSEGYTLETEKAQRERVFSNFFKTEVKILGVERAVYFKNVYTAGKASYIERNYAMIDDSDYCVFFYDEDYQVKVDVFSNNVLSSKSGTKIAYDYAVKKKKKIFNIFKILNDKNW